MGYELALSAVTPGARRAARGGSLLQDRCEALVLLGPQAPTAYLADLAARLPVVVVARAVRNRAVDVVRTDDAAGLDQAVDHLVELGHRRIAHVDGGRAPGAAERRRGYTDALHRHGLGSNTLMVTTIAQDAATMTELAVARAVARLDGTAMGEREQVVAPRLVVRGTTTPPAT